MLECQKYRKKPVVIEAIRYSGDNLAEVLVFTGKHPRFDEWFSSFDEYAAHVASDRQVFKILTLEGTMEASPGDWIIKGVKGEFYPCKPDIFEATYEPALSTVTPDEAGGLVERLQEQATLMKVLSPYFASACREAASLIQSQAAMIAALEAEAAKKDTALDAAFAYLEGSNPLHASGGYLNTDLRDKVRTARALPNKKASHD